MRGQGEATRSEAAQSLSEEMAVERLLEAEIFADPTSSGTTSVSTRRKNSEVQSYYPPKVIGFSIERVSSEAETSFIVR